MVVRPAYLQQVQMQMCRVARCCYLHLAVTSLRASSTMASSRWRLLPRVVRVTVSQGTPPITSTCSQCSVFLVSVHCLVAVNEIFANTKASVSYNFCEQAFHVHVPTSCLLTMFKWQGIEKPR